MSLANIPPRQSDIEDEIDLGHLFRVLYFARWRILALSMSVAVLAVFWVLSLTPYYQASTTLMIESEEVKAVSIEDVYSFDSSKKEYFLTQFEILKSRSLAGRVVDELSLVTHEEFDPRQQPKGMIATVKSYLPIASKELGAEEQLYRIRESVITQFLAKLTISPVGKTQLVRISFESKSPRLAAQVSNTVADAYIRSHLEAKEQMTRNATEWLDGRMAGVRSALEQSEHAVQVFQETHNLVDVEGVLGLAQTELNEITQQLLEAKKTLRDIESVRNVGLAKKNNIEELSELAAVANHPVISDIKSTEAKAEQMVSELSRRYGPKHPTMVAARQQLQAAKMTLEREIRKLLASVDNQYEAAMASVVSLETSLQDAKQDYQVVMRLESQFEQLQREVAVNKSLYNAFLKRLRETSETVDFAAANARVTDPALPPLSASKPKKSLIVVLAVMLAFMMGCAIAIVIDILKDGFNSPNDVEQYLKQRLVGLLPVLKGNNESSLPLRTFFEQRQGSFAESLRSMRTGLMLSHLDSPCQVVMVTSTVPGEGKTTVAQNLAFALKQNESSVLLIDADMRRPSIGVNFGLPQYRPGLSNLIAGSSSFSECVLSDESGIDIVAAGMVPANPQELLASKRFTELVESLRGKYEHIIIDSPPVGAVSDALILSRFADASLFVVKADSTKRKPAANALARLVQTGAKLDGVVLNQVDFEARSIDYGSYQGYYDAYGYQSENQEHTKA